MNNLTIRRLIERVSAGDIRIPAFQRDYVWSHDQVAFLIDSIYKGFPIGTIFLWKTDNKLKYEKDLGNFSLPEPSKNYPVNYVLDGQQRITSLFTVFQNEIKPNIDIMVNIYFDMEAKGSLQESLFLALEDEEVNKDRHFPIRTLFDPVEYRKSTVELSEERITLIDELQARFKEYSIPHEVFESDDRNAVAIVFERINRAGSGLSKFDLLSAWSWSEDFNLKEKFESLGDTLDEYGYSGLSNDKDLQLKICSAVLSGKTTPSAIFELSGDDLRNRFIEVENGIKGAIDFLKKELLVSSYEILPYSSLIVPLSAFFATKKSDGFLISSNQRDKLKRWFWVAVFNKRYSSDVNNRQKIDIDNLLKVKGDDNHPLDISPCDIRVNFNFDKFSKSIHTRALILLLANNNPLSLLSGSVINLENALKSVNKSEYHHIFPKKHLERQGIVGDKVNLLANFCFLSRGDNNKISDKSPKEYRNMIGDSQVNEVLSKSYIPLEFHNMDYNIFIEKRSKLLKNAALELMGQSSV